MSVIMTLAIFKGVLCESLKCITQLDHKKKKKMIKEKNSSLLLLIAEDGNETDSPQSVIFKQWTSPSGNTKDKNWFQNHSQVFMCHKIFLMCFHQYYINIIKIHFE